MPKKLLLQHNQTFYLDVLDTESKTSTRWIKEAVHIWKEEQQSLNRDKGSYTLTTSTTDFLPRNISIVARTGRRTQQASCSEGLWHRPKRQGKNVWLR